MELAQLLAPAAVDDFLADQFGSRPLHVRGDGEAGEARRSLVRWEDLNRLLAVRSHWTDENIKLIMNSRPVGAEHYMDDAQGGSGASLADPAKVELFLAMGASLVANSVEQISPRVRDVAAAIGRCFGATANANLYCSFRGVQAFDSHCDTHEVFAVQCEGEKVWRIYENRAEAPVAALTGPGAQQVIDAVKGAVLTEVHMRPGDLLYIPRGYYHDARAQSEDSLHLTFGVLPLTGRALFRILERWAMEDPAFRQYLPDGGRAPEALARHLAELAGRLRDMIGSDRFLEEVGDRQRARAPIAHRIDLPRRPSLEFYARTAEAGEVERRPSGALLRHGGGSAALGSLSDVAEWMLGQAAFSVQQAHRRYPWKSEAEIRGLARLLERCGLAAAYTPRPPSGGPAA